MRGVRKKEQGKQLKFNSNSFSWYQSEYFTFSFGIKSC